MKDTHAPSVQIIQVPYDSGRRGVRMGRGPAALAPPIAEAARSRGARSSIESIDIGDDLQGEAKVVFGLAAALIPRVRAALDAGSTPVVLSGNCNAAIGTVTAIDPLRTGIIWFDAHGEFNTPETTASGFLDGMGLAVATGRCWRTMAAAVPGFRPFPDTNIVLVGAREFDAEEERELQRTAIGIVRPRLIREWGVEGALVPTLAALRQRVSGVYVHLDLDVLDPSEGTANPFPASGGLTVDEVDAVMGLVRERFTIRGVGVASYDPEADRDGRARSAAIRLVDTVLMARASADMARR